MDRSNSLQRSFQSKPDPGQIDSVALIATLDANTETVRFLSDVAHEVDYSFYAQRGMKVQTFMKLRVIAFMDEFEEISDAVRLQKVAVPKLEPFREMPEYQQMRTTFREAVGRLASEDVTGYIKRVGRRSRNNLERITRTDNPELKRDAARTAVEIVAREIPQIGREPKTSQQVLLIPDSMARSLAAAFAERQITPPEIPSEPAEKEDAPS